MIALGLGLGACSSMQTSSTPTSTPTTTVSSSATTTSPTPTATPSLDDPATWVVEFGRVGPISLGDPLDQVSTAMSTFTDTTQEACPWVAAYDSPGYPSIWLPDGQSTGVVQQIVVQAWAAPADVSQEVLRTAQGVGIGSSLGALRSAYPELQELQGPHGSTIYGISDGTSQWITFGVRGEELSDDSLISTIVIRNTPHQDGEYCS